MLGRAPFKSTHSYPFTHLESNEFAAFATDGAGTGYGAAISPVGAIFQLLL